MHTSTQCLIWPKGNITACRGIGSTGIPFITFDSISRPNQVAITKSGKHPSSSWIFQLQWLARNKRPQQVAQSGTCNKSQKGSPTPSAIFLYKFCGRGKAFSNCLPMWKKLTSEFIHFPVLVCAQKGQCYLGSHIVTEDKKKITVNNNRG